MHDLRTTRHPELGRIAEIRARNGGSRVAECVGPVGHGLIAIEPHMCLEFDTCAVWLAAIVQ